MTAKPTQKSPAEPDAVSLAVQLLAKELRRRIQRHPSSHLLNGRESVELRLRLPTLDREGWIDDVSRGVSESIDQALSRLVIHRSVFRLGHVYCLRCASANCEHTTPNHCNEVFAGYSPSGLPRFQDLGQWLLEQQNPRVDQLYRSPQGLVTQITAGSVLTRSLLPAFQDADSGYHIHGQVAAGWYSFPTLDGLKKPVALTFQIVSTRPQRGRRRVGLNLIGLGPENEPLENLFDRAGEIPWLGATRWVEGILRDVERSLTRRKRPSEEVIEKRLDGLLTGLARRLEHQRRSRDRRTRHGQERHGDRDRPTEMAFSDLERARNEDILFDTRRQTLIVIGDRGRAHVFNHSGRLVTSIRYSPTSIARRRKKELWEPATDDQIGALRKQVSLTREEEA